MLKPIVAALLALLPVFGPDRKPELADAKAEQLASVAAAMATAVEAEKKWPGDKRELVAMLAAWGDHESHFSMRIGAGECESFECDPRYERNGVAISRLAFQTGGGTVTFQAVSFWQLHERTCSSREAWIAARTDMDRAAKEATRAIVRARWTCRSLERAPGDWVGMVFSSLAGRGCVGFFKGRDARVATYQRLIARAR